MKQVSAGVLKLVLGLMGAFIIFVGINVGFGGIATLGFQGDTHFFAITNSPVFLIRDSNVRFFGGLFIGIGLFIFLAITNLPRYQVALNLVFALLFIGGLARFTMLRLDIVLGANLIGSLAAELLLMPLLYFWVASVVKRQTAQPALERPIESS